MEVLPDHGVSGGNRRIPGRALQPQGESARHALGGRGDRFCDGGIFLLAELLVASVVPGSIGPAALSSLLHAQALSTHGRVPHPFRALCGMGGEPQISIRPSQHPRQQRCPRRYMLQHNRLMACVCTLAYRAHAIERGNAER